MIPKLIFVVIFAASAVGLVWLLSNRNVETDISNEIEVVTDFSGLDNERINRSGEVTHLPGTVASYEDTPPSDTPVVSHTEAEEVAEDFLEMSDSPNLYGVFYDKPSGSFTITLYTEDTKKARTEAEAYILEKLPYTKEQWCSFPITVITNANENTRWAGINLGLSFCPGSVQL